MRLRPDINQPATSLVICRKHFQSYNLHWNQILICQACQPNGTGMETFARPREFVDNPRYEVERNRELRHLSLENIDAPIREIVAGLLELPYCFTLQCCSGHFVHDTQPESDSFDSLPEQDVGTVTYRIAYIALCIQESSEGRRLHASLAEIPSIDPEYVQFGSPDWFWNRHLNSFALQVEPVRFADRDQAIIDHREALRVQEVRNQFIARLRKLVQSLQDEHFSA